MDTFNLRNFLKENKLKEATVINPKDIPGGEKGEFEDDFGTKIKIREFNLEGEEAIEVMEKIVHIQDVLEGESSDHVKLYLKSVIRDIQRGDLSIMRYTDDDVYEDFSNYIADKMSG